MQKQNIGVIMHGFSGSRSLGQKEGAQAVTVLRQLGYQKVPVAVGCAKGLDSVVRANAVKFGCPLSVFTAESQCPRHLVARSVSMVQAVALSTSPVLLGWPGRPCPAQVKPSPIPSRNFCGGGSGTWASLSLAAGLGCTVVVFGVLHAHLPPSLGKWSS